MLKRRVEKEGREKEDKKIIDIYLVIIFVSVNTMDRCLLFAVYIVVLWELGVAFYFPFLIRET